jgi:hypothetical protein
VSGHFLGMSATFEARGVTRVMHSRSNIEYFFRVRLGSLENSKLLYEFYKTLDCDTNRWLGHDERNEECSNRTSVTVRLITRV